MSSRIFSASRPLFRKVSSSLPPTEPYGFSDLSLASYVRSRWGPCIDDSSTNFSLRSLQEKVSADLRRIVSNGGEMGPMTYTALLQLFRRDGEVTEEIYKEMVDSGTPPREDTSVALLKGFALQRDLKRLKDGFKKLSNAPTRPLLNVFIYGLARCGQIDSAKQFVATMEATYGVPPNEVTYTSLLTYARSIEEMEETIRDIGMLGGLDEVEVEVEEVIEGLDDTAHRAVVGVLCRLDCFSRAYRLVRMRAECPGKANQIASYHSLLAASESAEVFANIWDECRREGLQHGSASLDMALTFALRFAEVPEDEYSRFAVRVVFGEGVSRRGHHYHQMLRICAQTGDHVTAERVRAVLCKGKAPLSRPATMFLLSAYSVAARREERGENITPIFVQEATSALDRICL